MIPKFTNIMDMYDDYLNHAWRNPEAELVSTFLCNLIGKDLHT